MSGEYYCIEEVDPTSYYRGDYDEKSNKSSNAGRRSFPSNHDNDARSTTSRKSQDLRLYEIEEQLEIAENRCNTLKGQLDTMKKIYQRSTKSAQPSDYRRTETSLNRKGDGSDNTIAYKNSRKRPNSPPTHQRGRPASPTKRRTVSHRHYESTDSVPQKSSSSSTAVIRTTVPLVRPKELISSQLIRQKPSVIGTDHSGAAVQTINNILTGITESVNRLSKMHINDKRNKKKVDSFTGMDVATTVFTVPIRAFMSQNEKKIFQPHLKNEESEMNNDEKPITEDWGTTKHSINNVKGKPTSKSKWSRHTSTKTSTRTKIQSSSGSVNLTKSVKSSARNIENVMKIRTAKPSLTDQESQSLIITRKRKRSVKRLKQGSKLSVGKKYSDHGTQMHYDDYGSDNLVELYHNVAAKASDSDESNSASKSHLNRQKGGGDLVITPIEPVIKMEVTKDETAQKKIVARTYQSQRMLAPINENTLMDDNVHESECYTTMSKNYTLPTIASKMKQVTKSYFQSFNFRSIPFCAAKSTTPSHNIGINIQQVMSIMKTRQPISGISATLAHNISLAAEKLQSRPLSVLVSTLSSKMGYGGNSQCPLIKGSLNREQLQEMAKEIPEEPEEEEEQEEAEYVQNETVSNTVACSRGAGGDREEDAIWSLDPSSQQRCTCASQKGVPFQQVLSKYQIPSNPTCVPSRPQTTKSHISRRYTKTTIDQSVRTQATKNWVKNESSEAVVASKKSERNTLKGREKNLKTVLINLHDEFDALNTKYENLAKGVDKNDTDVNNETLKELEDMEILLNKKEEEINMVMALYTEVLALKDQVKKLKDRASQPSIALSQKLSSEYKNPNAALHLTQLLRQIQQYQMRYKNKV